MRRRHCSYPEITHPMMKQHRSRIPCPRARLSLAWLVVVLGSLLLPRGSATAVAWPVPPAAQAEATPARSAPQLQHLARLGVERWRVAGQRGKGVRVAILDSGFRGYREHLGKSLPAHVLARSFRTDGNLEARDSQHGILCGEVVHALAPDAELLLANWQPEQPETFLQAVAWARGQGARVISCSCIMPNWSDG